MKTIKLSLALILAAGLFTGCNKSEHELDMPTNPTQEVIRLNSSIELGITPSRSIQSRLQDTQIVDNRTLNLFVTGAGEPENVVYNTSITSIEDGKFSHPTMYYPTSGNNIDFYALHPYQSETKPTDVINFSVKTDQSMAEGYLDSDLLYASVKDVARQKEAVTLKFTHKLSKFEFTIKQGDGADLSELNKVTILGMKPETSLNLGNGLLGTASGTAAEVTAYGTKGLSVGETEVTGIEAVVVPQVVPQGVKLFKITVGNIDYYYTTTKEFDFKEGKKNILQLTINQTGIELKSSIENWATGETIIGNGEAD